MLKRSAKWMAIAICIAPFVWVVFLFNCRPTVALHYSAEATDSLGYFLNDNHSITKRGLKPGESVKYPTAMFPEPDMWILLTFPFQSDDFLEITKPFSRIDVFIGPGAKIKRTEVRHGFFARF
jgi:hypothetical protein